MYEFRIFHFAKNLCFTLESARQIGATAVGWPHAASRSAAPRHTTVVGARTAAVEA